MKEATARIKINKLLEAAHWRFFADSQGPANIQLEPSVALTKHALDDLGENFEKASKGFIDFLLLNEKGFPFIVLEAKAEDKNPLAGKEQARKYAKSQNCRFVILSNGNLHYFWDLERGNPYVITSFPTPVSVTGYQKSVPDPKRLVAEVVENDYVALTQRPGFAAEAAWKSEAERPRFIELNGLRFLRPYQKRAIVAIQQTVAKGGDRFLLEMATGTGKTLTSAAIIKLFLRTGNARRVLFLVDRLELEDQALKAFRKVLANDYKSVIYKENRDDWRHAEIVVSTVQSLLFNNKYQQLFSPTDFDLVISDEAHRSIGGNARAVFDYFIGYKLGLTATPRDYLKKFVKDKPTSKDPREFERRLLLDTYRTFGCEDGQPTFRYSLLDGVKDGYLVNPTIVDARSEVTTQLLSDGGFVVEFKDEEGDDQKETYKQRQFEKRFFSPATNQLFCKAFLENALRDPISGEIGKSIIFAVSQNHAAKLVQILNGMADRMFPGKYQSDFAVQVTSHVDGAQQYTIKRRIDTARDILVGKVPDPKSQVEQITIALIYKFMDDMDAEAEELGGKRKFFTGEFARYGWAQLMRAGIGGHEMLALYAEGIAKMPENPGIPALFREIFKNAYLPYRDPETLKAFLKIIDEFNYDHSERLGDAFEYLLSVLGSQGDAGQFRTPRHIIDFIVEILDPKKDESVLDPACGTAGFLISAYKHILKSNSSPEAVGSKTIDENDKAALDSSRIPPSRGDLLTPDERGKLATNFKGYDISPDMVRLSLVNLYLHGFTDPHIYEYDTLTSEERWNEFADVILANPPFMSPKGGIKPHRRFSIQAKRSEVLFVD
jgi:hypothetical protein